MCLLNGMGIKTPRRYAFDDLKKNFPDSKIIAKPRTGGSSVGIKLMERIDDFFRLNKDPSDYIFEEYIDGYNISLACLELSETYLIGSMVEIHIENGFYDNETKNDENSVEYFCPPRNMTEKVKKDIIDNVRNIVHEVGYRGFVRFDLIFKDDHYFFLEANTIPGLSFESNFVVSTRHKGLNYDQILLAIMKSYLWEKN